MKSHPCMFDIFTSFSVCVLSRLYEEVGTRKVAFYKVREFLFEHRSIRFRER